VPGARSTIELYGSQVIPRVRELPTTPVRPWRSLILPERAGCYALGAAVPGRKLGRRTPGDLLGCRHERSWPAGSRAGPDVLHGGGGAVGTCLRPAGSGWNSSCRSSAARPSAAL